MYNSLPFFNSEFKFLLMHELNFHVTGLSYGSNTRDVMRRVPRSWAAFDVVATATSNWILVATAYRWILTATVSSRPSRSEFQHSSPTFGSGILATAVGTSSWRASPAVENAFVDDTDVVAAATFFFVTDDTFMPTFKLLPL
jgi:hypothetical protein